MIIVTGATGGLGSEIIRQLLRLVPPERVAASARHPAAAAHWEARGVRIRRGDFDEPPTLDDAFAGAEHVLVISTVAPNERRFAQQRNAIEAARRAGARSVVYTSVLQRRGSLFAAAPGHIATEDYLERSDGSYTIVRNGQYIENLPMFLGRSIQSGDLALPPDGPTSWVARADLAEGIARLLVDDFAGRRSLCLTGPEALTFTQVAAIASRAVGRTIARRAVTAAEYVALLVERGLPRAAAELYATGFASRAAGEVALVDPALEAILGRPRTTVAELLPELLAGMAQAALR